MFSAAQTPAAYGDGVLAGAFQGNVATLQEVFDAAMWDVLYLLCFD